MCGIVGTIGQSVDKKFISSSISALRHRGPDADGFWIDKTERIFFGHTRLSILDLTAAGQQPRSYIDKKGYSYQIVFNGEVYNYREIREELVGLGYVFDSDCDTEVVLISYVHWGKACVDKFRGMFAFAIYDETCKKVVLCRDRFGVKPLYFAQFGKSFLFASELKALFSHSDFRKQLNQTAIAQYFQLGFIPAPLTVFEHCYKLQPGHWLEYDYTSQMCTLTKYWKAEQYFTSEYADMSEQETINQLEGKLVDSFKYRMVSDVDVGLFLSGGIDSSLVATLLQKHTPKKIQTFTIGFGEKAFDEAPYARRIASALSTDHHELYVTSKNVSDEYENYSQIFDEPFGDSSGFPTFLLSKYTQKYVKVALSGDGGDELFSGYSKYGFLWKLSQMTNIELSVLRSLSFVCGHQRFVEVCNKLLRKKYTNLYGKISKLDQVLSSNTFRDRFYSAGTYWNQGEMNQLFLHQRAENIFEGMYNETIPNNIEQMQVWDMNVYLPDDILVKTDRTTMAVGLEGREPFLDHTILEFMAKVDPQMKFKKLGSKYLLRKILFQYIDPQLFDRPKSGFVPPITRWLQDDLNGMLSVYFDKAYIKKQGIFHPEYVDTLLRLFRMNPHLYSAKVWILLQFQTWWDQYGH